MGMINYALIQSCYNKFEKKGLIYPMVINKRSGPNFFILSHVSSKHQLKHNYIYLYYHVSITLYNKQAPIF